MRPLGIMCRSPPAPTTTTAVSTTTRKNETVTSVDQTRQGVDVTMVPAPKMDDVLDNSVRFSQPPRTIPQVHFNPLVSPTGLSHAMPRPKSPRHPGRKCFSTGPGLLSAQHFHNTASEKQQVPAVPVTEEKLQHEHEEQQQQQYPRNSRTRSRDRIGKFQEVPQRLQPCTTQSARQSSREFARRVKPVAQDSFRGCVRESIYVGRRMTECLAFTSDIYQQECSNNHRHRGDDAMFFASAEAKNFARRAESSSLEDPSDNSMARSESDDYVTRPRASSVRKGRTPSRNEPATPTKDNYSNRKSKSAGGYRKSKSPGKAVPSERDYGYPSERAERKSSPTPNNKAPIGKRRVSPIESDYESSASPSRSRRSPTRESRELAPSESDYVHLCEVTESTFTTPSRESKSPIPLGISPIQRNESDRTPWAVEADKDESPYRSNKGIRYPEAPKIMDDSFTTDPPTPDRDHLRRPRGAYDQDDSMELLKPPLLMRQPGTKYTDMRDLRMCMFVQDENNEKVVPEARFSRTLEQLEIQDGSIKKLETELRESKNVLDRTRHELTLTRKASAQQKQVGTATAEKLYGDRVDIEEKLRREMRENDKLLEQISGLRNEKARLTTTLEDGSVGQVEVTRPPDQSMGPTVPPSPSPSDEQNPVCPATEEGLQESADRSMYFSSLVISLRAEIVELKCELAEARAAQLAAKQSQKEIEDGNIHVRAEGEKLREQVKQLKQEIEVMDQQASQKKREGELEIQQLQAQLKCLQEKLVMTVQDVLRRSDEHQTTEKVLNETQDEATELRQQVASLISKVERLEVKSDSRNKVSVEEAKKLQGETSTLKEKLSKSHREIIDQAAEHLKERQRMEEVLWQSQQEAHALQSKVITLDDQVAAAEDEVKQLRMIKQEDDKASCATDASRSSQIVRYMNRRMAGADSSVMEMFRGERHLSGTK
jgi:hypothetical protein